MGKSTLGNRYNNNLKVTSSHPHLVSSLLGLNEEDKEADCSESKERPFKFGVGHGSKSMTVETSWLVMLCIIMLYILLSSSGPGQVKVR